MSNSVKIDIDLDKLKIPFEEYEFLIHKFKLQYENNSFHSTTPLINGVDIMLDDKKIDSIEICLHPVDLIYSNGNYYSFE